MSDLEPVNFFAVLKYSPFSCVHGMRVGSHYTRKGAEETNELITHKQCLSGQIVLVNDQFVKLGRHVENGVKCRIQPIWVKYGCLGTSAQLFPGIKIDTTRNASITPKSNSYLPISVCSVVLANLRFIWFYFAK